MIFSTCCLYLASFYQSFASLSPFEVARDEVHVIVKEPGSDVSKDERAKLIKNAKDGTLKELDVTETVTLTPKKPGLVRSMLTGLPSPTSNTYSILTVALNLLVTLMTLDLVYRGPIIYKAHDLTFTRVGHTSFDSARILLREPDASQSPVFLNYRQADPSAPAKSWKDGGTLRFPNDINQGTDFTGALSLTHLLPETRYEFSWSNGQRGHLVTAPTPGKMPSLHNGTYTFLHSSCIKPQVPYNPIKHPLHIPGFVKLAKWLPELGAQFMLFLGDFIYVDVPHRFGKDAETYRSEYRRMYASPDWPSVSSSADYPLPWIHVWDDHEIQNDWDGNSTGVYASAADPFQHYQINVNPPPVRSTATWFTFIQGPAAFFLMDTRSYRSPESKDATDPKKTMLGQEQLLDLLHWIREPVPSGVKWKFVVSSIPFTKNWHFGSTDTWGTYLIERQLILEAAWETSSKSGIGMIVLSGDRHEFAATQFPPPPTSQWPATSAVYEFSTSPLSMFYLPIRTYKQTDDEDVTLKYLPDGNSKFGAVEIRTPEFSENSVLQYRLFIDGEEAWGYSITSPPVTP